MKQKCIKTVVRREEKGIEKHTIVVGLLTSARERGDLHTVGGTLENWIFNGEVLR